MFQKLAHSLIVLTFFGSKNQYFSPQAYSNIDEYFFFSKDLRAHDKKLKACILNSLWFRRQMRLFEDLYISLSLCSYSIRINDVTVFYHSMHQYSSFILVAHWCSYNNFILMTSQNECTCFESIPMWSLRKIYILKVWPKVETKKEQGTGHPSKWVRELLSQCTALLCC